MDWFTAHFLNVELIKGGIRLDLSYASIIALAWISVALGKRLFKKKAG